jgi:predicted RNA-binding Zn ribbon-like protein
MQAIDSKDSDWRGKFLFVGNQLALDLLNTSLVQDDRLVELLTTPADLAAWLASADLISAKQAAGLSQHWCTPEAATELSELLSFREHLRSAVLDTEAGKLPSPAFVAELNQWLSAYPTVQQARIQSSSLTAATPMSFTSPRDAMRPIAAAALDVLTNVDHTRLRKCGGCVVHFLDTSKKGSRRWCSMNICGNRRKVAAYQGRKKEQSRHAH